MSVLILFPIVRKRQVCEHDN